MWAFTPRCRLPSDKTRFRRSPRGLSFALALLTAIEQGAIPRSEVSALTIRQLQALDDKQVSERLAKVWGDIRQTSAEKKLRSEQYKSQLSADKLKSADAVARPGGLCQELRAVATNYLARADGPGRS